MGFCREVSDAIPVPLDPLREVVTAVRNSLGTNAPQGFEVRPNPSPSTPADAHNHVCAM